MDQAGWPLKVPTEVIKQSMVGGTTISLREAVSKIFRRHPLELLHTLQAPASPEPTHDQGTALHRHFYRSWDEMMDAYYGHVVAYAVSHVYLSGGDVVVQRVPTFRVHLPGGTATKEFHRDVDYGHPIQTVNVIVALTDMVPNDGFRNGNSLHIQMDPEEDLFENPALEAGELLVFMGGVLRHGSYVNDIGRTRVSLDFRILERRYLPAPGTVTVNRKVPLGLGSNGYYRSFET